MHDRRTTLLIERLRGLAARKTRFSYDVRGDAFVTSDIVVAYSLGEEGRTDLVSALEHALTHDAIVSGVKQAESGQVQFSSCRLFTDIGNALRFAREQGSSMVYNWNRMEDVAVPAPVPAGIVPSAQ